MMRKRWIRRALGILLALTLSAGSVCSGTTSAAVYAAETEEGSDEEETTSARISEENTGAAQEESSSGDSSDGLSNDNSDNGNESEESSSDSTSSEEDVSEEDARAEGEDSADADSSESGNAEEDSVQSGDGETDSDPAEDSEAEEDGGEEEEESDELPEEESEEEEEEESFHIADGELVEETYIPDADSLADNDELFAAYVESVLYEGLEEASNEPAAASNYGLSIYPDGSTEYSLYTQLKSAIADIAAGGGSTKITFATEVVFTFTNTDGETTSTFKSNSVSEMSSIWSTMVECLMADCPYELYWFDKNSGYGKGGKWSTSGSGTDMTYSYTFSYVYFYVETAYRGTDDDGNISSLIVDPDIATAASTTAESAAEVVNEYAGYGDYDKLVAYKEWICGEVSYNSDYSDYYTEYGYGDPWQIIWVFDGDEDTNVVCEGYSKAFQYLCDLSEFDNKIVCYTVSGDMNGGGHMWNIVRMEDGQYYLVDITNSDSGKSGQYGGLFLVGCNNGDYEEGYNLWVSRAQVTVTTSGLNTSTSYSYSMKYIEYVYDEDVITLYGGTILTLASSDYSGLDRIEITSQSEDAGITTEDSITLSVTASAPEGSGNLSYQWLQVTKSSSSYSISKTLSSKTDSLTLSGLSEGIWYYACMVYDADSGSGVITEPITITVTVADTSTEITDVSGVDSLVTAPVAGETAQTEVDAGDDADYTASISWSPEDVIFEYDTEYTVTLTLTANDDYLFAEDVCVPEEWSSSRSDDGTELVLTHTYDKTESALAVLTIDTQPSDTDITYGESAELSVSASSTDSGASLTYQWFEVTSDGESEVSGAESAVLELTGLSAGSYTYYCVVSDGVNSITSDPATVTVARIDLSDDSNVVSVAIGSAVSIDTGQSNAYTGKEVTPPVSVSVNDVLTTEGTDYTCEYSSNIDAGTAVITITGIGNYTGTIPVTFTIERAQIGDVSAMGSLVAAPAAGAEVLTSVEFEEDAEYGYSASLSWDTEAETFGLGVSYTATLTLTADSNHLFTEDTVLPDGWTGTLQDEGETLVLVRIYDATESSIGGTSGDLTWIYDAETGTLSVTGTGEMETYTEENPAPWSQYALNISEVTIGDGVTSISESAFAGFTALTDVTIGEDVTVIGSSAFSGCTSLAEIVIPSGVTGIGDEAFSGCTSLATITFEGSAPAIGSNAFLSVTAIAYYTEDDTWTADVLLDYGGTITWVSMDGITIEHKGQVDGVFWTIDSTGRLTLTGSGGLIITSENPLDDYSEVVTDAPWYDYLEDITSAEVSVSGMTSTACLFAGMTNLISVTFSDDFDTSQVTDMKGMFYGCRSLTSLNVSGFNTSNVTDMSAMFALCRKLTSLDVSSFDTSNVTDMSYLFSYCGVKELDLSGFDTSKVTSMADMFTGADLISLNVSSFDTSSVTNMTSMFNTLDSLTSLDVSSFDTSKVTDMSWMFNGCSSLTTLDLSGFDTSSVKYMNGMFIFCSGLTSLDISGFDTSSVVTMPQMFMYDGSLESLDLGSFDTSQCYDFSGMFAGCSSLTSLDLGSFDTSQCYDFSCMFEGCSSLISLNLSSFDMSNSAGWSGDESDLRLNDCTSLEELYTPAKVFWDLALPYTMYDTDNAEWTVIPAGLTASIYLVSTPRTYAITFWSPSSASDLTEAEDSIALTLTYNQSQTVSGILVGKTIADYADVEDSQIAVPEETGIDGYTFVGWYTGESGTGTLYTSDTVFEEDTSVYAYYTAQTNLTLYGFIVEEIEAQVYTGSAIKPEPQVYDGSTLLVKGTDYTLSYKNNTNAGTATITVKGKGNYTSTTTIHFTIVPKNLSEEDIAVTVAETTGTKTFTPSVTVKRTITSGTKTTTKTLSKTKDYTITLLDQDGKAVSSGKVDPSDSTVVANNGTYSILISAGTNGNYTGSVSVTGHVAANKISSAVLGSSIAAQTFTGAELEPEFTLYSSSKKTELLTKDVDYSVTYSNNVNVGTAKITITGIGSWSGTKTFTFKINKVNLSSLDDSQLEALLYASEESLESGDTGSHDGELELTYSAAAQKPVPVLVYSPTDSEGNSVTDEDGEAVSNTLVKGTDFTVKYANNTNVPTSTAAGKQPTVTITGKGNYTGSVKLTFQILKKELSEVTLSEFTVSVAVYTKSVTTAFTPTVTVKFGKSSLTKKKDFVVESVDPGSVAEDGKYQVTITVPETSTNYKGSVTVTGYAGKRALTDSSISAVLVETDEDGSSVSYGSGELSLTYNASAQKPDVRIIQTDSDGETVTLVAGTDYTVKYSNNTNAASSSASKAPTVTITGKGAYTGSVKLTFTIEEKVLSDDAVYSAGTDEDGNEITESTYTVTVADVKYTGKSLSPSVKVVDNETGKTLTKNKDYTITYVNNKAIGEAADEDFDDTQPHVIITGKGNYAGTVIDSSTGETVTGTIRKNFRIYKTAISTATALSVASQAYTGSEITPDVTLYADKKKTVLLTEGIDYTLSYSNNIKKGTATITITGMGDYGGTKSVKFKITSKSLTGVFWFLYS